MTKKRTHETLKDELVGATVAEGVLPALASIVTVLPIAESYIVIAGCASSSPEFVLVLAIARAASTLEIK